MEQFTHKWFYAWCIQEFVPLCLYDDPARLIWWTCCCNALILALQFCMISQKSEPNYDFWIVIFCMPQWRYSVCEDICFPLIWIVLQQSTQSSFIKLLHHCRLWAPALQRCSSRELFYGSSGQESSSTLFQSFNQLARSPFLSPSVYSSAHNCTHPLKNLQWNFIFL